MDRSNLGDLPDEIIEEICKKFFEQGDAKGLAGIISSHRRAHVVCQKFLNRMKLIPQLATAGNVYYLDSRGIFTIYDDYTQKVIFRHPGVIGFNYSLVLMKNDEVYQLESLSPGNISIGDQIKDMKLLYLNTNGHVSTDGTIYNQYDNEIGKIKLHDDETVISLAIDVYDNWILLTSENRVINNGSPINLHGLPVIENVSICSGHGCILDPNGDVYLVNGKNIEEYLIGKKIKMINNGYLLSDDGTIYRNTTELGQFKDAWMLDNLGNYIDKKFVVHDIV